MQWLVFIIVLVVIGIILGLFIAALRMIKAEREELLQDQDEVQEPPRPPQIHMGGNVIYHPNRPNHPVLHKK